MTFIYTCCISLSRRLCSHAHQKKQSVIEEEILAAVNHSATKVKCNNHSEKSLIMYVEITLSMPAARFVVADVICKQSGNAHYLSGETKYQSDQSVHKSKQHVS